MEPEELKDALKKLGIKDPTDVKEVTAKVRGIYFNNAVAFFPNPLDTVNVLLEIDYEHKHFVYMYMNRNRWRKQVKGFAAIEAIDGIATEIAPPMNGKPHTGGVIEYEDGTFRDMGLGEGAQLAAKEKVYRGSAINIAFDNL